MEGNMEDIRVETAKTTDGKMNVETALVSLRMEDDWDVRDRAKKDLAASFGKEVARAIEDAVTAIDEQDYREKAQALVKTEGLDVGTATQLLVKIGAERSHATAKMPIRSIMSMYRSGDGFLVQTAMKYLVINYGKYVHDVIHRRYSTYADKNEDELFNCGCIGMLKALKNYDPDYGAFTTYSKFFIMHEITDQINYYNGSTVYYTGVQKQIKEARARLQEEGTDPTDLRVSIATGLKPEIVARETKCMEAMKHYYLDSDDAKEFPCAYEATPEYMAQQKEGMESLFEAISRLDPLTKTVVLLKYDGTRTNEEVARLASEKTGLDVTIGQVKSLYQKGLKTLRQDKRLCGAYSEYISDAEREMLKYSMPRMETKRRTDEALAAVEDAIDEAAEAAIAEHSTGTEDPFAQALDVMMTL